MSNDATDINVGTILKPCPFCGADAYITDHENGLTGSGDVWIYCTVCQAEMRDSYILDAYSPKIGESCEGVKKILIKKWNARQ